MAKLEPEERKLFKAQYNKEANRLTASDIKRVRDSVMILSALIPNISRFVDSLDNMLYYKMKLEED